MNRALFAALLALSFSLTSCGGTSGGDTPPTPTPTPTVPAGTNNIRVNWSANREAAVNRAGGGFRVFYGTVAGFSVATAESMDVPYVSGISAPTTALITGLQNGTYYIKVVGYSSLVGPSGGIGSTSVPSAETSVTVP